MEDDNPFGEADDKGTMPELDTPQDAAQIIGQRLRISIEPPGKLKPMLELYNERHSTYMEEST